MTTSAAERDAAILRADGLVKYYADGHVQALRGVSLRINASESVAITGPSGCGKSTLLHLLGGLDRPDRGRGLLPRASRCRSSTSTTSAPTRSALSFKRSISCPRSRRWRISRSPCSRRTGRRASASSEPSRLIEEVGLADRGSHRPSQLSIGQRQRIAIARSLANDPCLLLADEPTGNLDSKSQDEIIQLLHRLRDERQLTLLIVTHSHEVAQAADRRIPMKDGQIQPA